jgi:hypothetical protein
MLFCRHVDPTFLWPFGCLAYALIPKDSHDGKLSQKGRKCIMLGYKPGKKAYQLLDVVTQKAFASWHVVFNKRGADKRPGDLLQGDSAEPSNEQWEEMLNILLRRTNVDNPDHVADAPGAPPPPGDNDGSVGGDPNSDHDLDNDDDGPVGAPPHLPPPNNCPPLPPTGDGHQPDTPDAKWKDTRDRLRDTPSKIPRCAKRAAPSTQTTPTAPAHADAAANEGDPSTCTPARPAHTPSAPSAPA